MKIFILSEEIESGPESKEIRTRMLRKLASELDSSIELLSDFDGREAMHRSAPLVRRLLQLDSVSQLEVLPFLDVLDQYRVEKDRVMKWRDFWTYLAWKGYDDLAQLAVANYFDIFDKRVEFSEGILSILQVLVIFEAARANPDGFHLNDLEAEGKPIREDPTLLQFYKEFVKLTSEKSRRFLAEIK